MTKGNRQFRNILYPVLIFIITGSLFVLTSCVSFLAEVNGYKITQKEVDRYTASLKGSKPDIFKKENKDELIAIEKQIVDYIIENRVLKDYGDTNKISVTEEEIENELKVIKEPHKDDFQEYLKKNYMDEDFLKVLLKDQMLSAKIFDSVTSDITVADDEVKKYYEENKESLFKTPEQIEVSHILVKFGENDTMRKTKEAALEKIKVAQEKLNDGSSFEDIARRYSEDENTNTKGGALGYFPRGMLVPEFEEIAFNLKIDEISDIVETAYGFHIIKVTDKKPETITPFTEIETQLKDYLVKEKKGKAWEAFKSDLLQKAEVKYGKIFKNQESATTGTTSQKNGTESNDIENLPEEEQLITPTT